MKRVRYEQIRIITGSTVSEYNEALNDALRELRDKEPRVDFHPNNPMFAYVRYEVTEKVAESLADEYELKGIRFRCIDCPLIKGRDDARRRRYWCKYNDCIDINSRACEEFYRRLARGEIPWEEGDTENESKL